MTLTGQIRGEDALGARVRAARERLGWTREALAFHSGMSWSAIAQVESGRRRNVRPTTLAALARPLGVTIDYLAVGTLSRPMLGHSTLPYRTDDQFRTTIGPFLAEGVELSEAVLAVTTAAKIELLREQLGKAARSVEFVEARDWYSTPLAALAAYRSFCETKLEQGAAWVRIVGEPVWAGRSDAHVRLWTLYESLLNYAFAGFPLTLVCPYDERSVDAEIVRQAHLTHPHTIGGDGVVSSNAGYTDPGQFALSLSP